MKDKIIETAGRAWKFLGENGETDVTALGRRLKEKNDVVLQSLGWLAREDKINYKEAGSKTLISLIESEKRIFDSIIQDIQQAESSTKQRRKGRKAKSV